MNTNLFYIVMAALGGYAAWLAIQDRQAKKQAKNDWFINDAFSDGFLDYYGVTDSSVKPSYINRPGYHPRTRSRA